MSKAQWAVHPGEGKAGGPEQHLKGEWPPTEAPLMVQQPLTIYDPCHSGFEQLEGPGGPSCSQHMHTGIGPVTHCLNRELTHGRPPDSSPTDGGVDESAIEFLAIPPKHRPRGKRGKKHRLRSSPELRDLQVSLAMHVRRIRMMYAADCLVEPTVRQFEALLDLSGADVASLEESIEIAQQILLDGAAPSCGGAASSTLY